MNEAYIMAADPRRVFAHLAGGQLSQTLWGDEILAGVV
jgi:hypothetical protein